MNQIYTRLKMESLYSKRDRKIRYTSLKAITSFSFANAFLAQIESSQQIDSAMTQCICYDPKNRARRKSMSLIISDDIIKASGLSEREFFIEIVLMLFQQDKISLGKASELLGMHRMQFQKLLTDRNLYVHYDVAEFQEDLKTLQEMS